MKLSPKLESGFHSQFSLAGGYRLHAVVADDNAEGKPPLLFLHGLIVSHRYMMPTARLLTDHFNVYLIDMPGYGASERPARALSVEQLAVVVSQWLKVNRLGAVHLVSSSFGCQVAAHLAAHYPDLVASLVLIAPTVDPAAQSLYVEVWNVLLDAFRESPQLLLLVLADLLSMGVLFALQAVGNMLRFPLERDLPAVRQPTLVVRGDRDPIVSERWTRIVAQLLPNGIFMSFPGGSHALNFLAAEPLSDAIRAFLLDGNTVTFKRPRRRA